MAIVKPHDFAPSTIAESAKVDENFDIPYALLNGTSTDQETIHRFNSGSVPVLRLDQLGSGPILVGRENLTERFKFLIDGKVFHAAIIDVNGNEILIPVSVASAVNEFSMANAAAGNPPELRVTGGDADIAMKLVPKGTGKVKIQAADPVANEDAAHKSYVDNKRHRWAASGLFIEDPTVPPTGSTAILPLVKLPGSTLVATHVGAVFNGGSASGQVEFAFFHLTSAVGSITSMGSVSFNPGTVNVPVETDIANVPLPDKGFLAFTINSRSSPAQRSISLWVRGYRTPEDGE